MIINYGIIQRNYFLVCVYGRDNMALNAADRYIFLLLLPVIIKVCNARYFNLV